MKKNKTITILAVFIFLLLISACAKKEIKNIDSNGKNIVCFGDSITFGYGVNVGEDFPSALGKMVNMPVINSGVDGDTSAQGLKRIKSDVLDHNPLIVLIEFGGNDFTHKVPMDETINNIREIVRLIQSKGSMTAIVDISAGLFMRDYRVRLSKLASETGSIFVPQALNRIITNPSMKSDFMHPNIQGYKIVAERVHKAISPYLGKIKK